MLLAEQSGYQFCDAARHFKGSLQGADTPLGRTYSAPDFTDQKWWQNHADITRRKSLIAIVTRGKGNMPAFGKKLNRSEISVLVKYIRQFHKQTGTTNSK